MAANVAVAQDPAGNLKPAKDKSTERIDGIVATIMAIGRANGRPGRAAGPNTPCSLCELPMAANVTVTEDPPGNLKPAKGKSTERGRWHRRPDFGHRPRHGRLGESRMSR